MIRGTKSLTAVVVFLFIPIPRTVQAQRYSSEQAGLDEVVGSIVHQGRNRTFLLHIPKKVEGRKDLPVVFVLHGGGGTPKSVASLTGFSKLAAEEGFVVVYPQAVNRHWNDGRQVRQFLSHREKVDDVGFIELLIDTLVVELNVDSTRIYAVGISNGGMMCHRLGIELSHRLAAFASVAASLPENLMDKKPKMPIAVLMINGTADPVVPFEGGGVGLFAQRGRVVSVAKAVEFWVNMNGCNIMPIETTLVSDGDLPVRKTVYRNGRFGTEVELLTFAGGGHTWPGGRQRPSFLGQKSDAINATKVIWEFLSRHQR
ncbi:MAG: extracellular catalytic domain type 1 short-chain-length polyhydroxyalkanoate depolymerase [bacterium]